MVGWRIADIVSRAIALLLGLTFHEFSHAWMAYRMGDRTAKQAGRVTLNPLVHLDLSGAIMFVLLLLGMSPIAWGKPVPINPYYMRNRRWGVALSTAAGPLSNLTIALTTTGLVRLAFTLIPGHAEAALLASPGLFLLIANMLIINIALALFNLLPLPPLDGFHIVEAFAPPAWERALGFIHAYGPWILLVLIFMGFLGGPNVLGAVLSPGQGTIFSWLVNLAIPPQSLLRFWLKYPEIFGASPILPLA